VASYGDELQAMLEIEGNVNGFGKRSANLYRGRGGVADAIPSALQMNLFPDPAHGSFEVSFRAPADDAGANAFVIVFDATGRELYRSSLLLPSSGAASSEQHVQVNLSTAPPGEYFVSVRTPTRFECRSIIIAR
jgi:hypothetical protein